MFHQYTIDMPMTDHVQPSAMAIISSCGLYRYQLMRHIPTLVADAGCRDASVLWIMLNGSTADALKNDPTIRKCVAFTQLWRPRPQNDYEGPQAFRRMFAGNLFGLRATYPKDLHATIRLQGLAHAIGPDNDAYLSMMISCATRIVLAWGTHAERKKMRPRVRDVMALLITAIKARPAGLPPPEVGCLGLNKGGSPQHPLMVGYAQPFVPFPHLTVDMFEAIT